MTTDGHTFEDPRSWSSTEVHRQARAAVEAKLTTAGATIEGETRHGLVARLAGGRHYEIFVKGATSLYYVYIPKTTFPARNHQALALVMFFESEPEAAYLIPGSVFRQPQATLTRLIKNRDYVGKQSAPEYGLNLTETTLPLLERFRFEDMVRSLG